MMSIDWISNYGFFVWLAMTGAGLAVVGLIYWLGWLEHRRVARSIRDYRHGRRS